MKFKHLSVFSVLLFAGASLAYGQDCLDRQISLIKELHEFRQKLHAQEKEDPTQLIQQLLGNLATIRLSPQIPSAPSEGSGYIIDPELYERAIQDLGIQLREAINAPSNAIKLACKGYRSQAIFQFDCQSSDETAQASVRLSWAKSDRNPSTQIEVRGRSIVEASSNIMVQKLQNDRTYLIEIPDLQKDLRRIQSSDPRAFLRFTQTSLASVPGLNGVEEYLNRIIIPLNDFFSEDPSIRQAAREITYGRILKRSPECAGKYESEDISKSFYQ